MFVFIPGSIRPVGFGQAGTVPAEISIPASAYIYVKYQWDQDPRLGWTPYSNAIGYSEYVPSMYTVSMVSKPVLYATYSCDYLKI